MTALSVAHLITYNVSRPRSWVTCNPRICIFLLGPHFLFPEGKLYGIWYRHYIVAMRERTAFHRLRGCAVMP
jgi:hypothetical protein